MAQVQYNVEKPKRPVNMHWEVDITYTNPTDGEHSHWTYWYAHFEVPYALVPKVCEMIEAYLSQQEKPNGPA